MAMSGANPIGSETYFRVWAPKAKTVELRLKNKSGETKIPMEIESEGVFGLTAEAEPGDRYSYLLDGESLQLPDPVSRLLPEGVHGPTEVVDPHAFEWTDDGWRGVPFRDYILYEIHVGTFTPPGTFDGVIQTLDYLKELGVTAIELLPVAAFPGKHNWGYDGVSMYAVQESYGGPDGLKRLVDAAHAKGIAVVMDVVYNHVGNEGNYLGKFGPYFTSKHKTPWGDAINYDDKDSAEVREYIIQNALYWIREYHIDGLRMDAVHTIQDDSPTHIVAAIRDAVQQYAAEAKRHVALMAETDENSLRYIKRRPTGYGLDAVWSDDFHHAVHALFTGEREGYYQDFGKPEQLVKAVSEGFVFQGETFGFWGRPRGESSRGMPLDAHIICIQNHDQVGNRATGERLTQLLPLSLRKMLAAILLLAPETPLLFMGQESDEPSPFQFFTDYGDPVLQKAVTEGRRKEFESFAGFGGEVPDPQDPATFERSKLTWDLTAERREMLEWYRQLIAIRKLVYKSGEKTCAARLVDGGLELRAPRGNPKMVLRANWTGVPLKGSGENQILTLNEGEVQLSIWLSPETEEITLPFAEEQLSVRDDGPPVPYGGVGQAGRNR